MRRTGWSRPDPVTVAVWIATALVGLWAVRFLLGGELPPGNDITGHLQRADFGLDVLARHGRADGWYPRSMFGYQLYLFYGPGLSVALAVVRVVSLGTASTAGALEIVLVASYLAVAPAMARLARVLGASTSAAWAAGMLALAAGSTRGGGIDGAFNTGLAAQQLAVPLVLLALAQIVARLRSPTPPRTEPGPRPGPLALAATVTALAYTHPISVVLLALFVPVVVAVFATAATAGAGIDRRGVRTVVVAAAWTVAASAAWWLPAVLGRSLRGPITSFTLPSVTEHFELLVAGDRGWRGVAGAAVALGLGVAAVDVVGTPHRRRLALVALPFATLAVLHTAHGALGLDSDLGRQLPNRGLVFVALFATVAVSEVLDRAVRDVAARLGSARGVAAGAWALAGVVVVVSVSAATPPDSDRQRPTPALSAAAELLRDEVPPGAAFITIGDGTAGGVPEFGRWLAWQADVATRNPFGPEYSPGAGAAGVALAGPADDTAVDIWLDVTQTLAVTHVVTADDRMASRLGGNARLDRRLVADDISVWAIVATPGHPVGSPVPSESATVVEATDTHVVVRVTDPVERRVRLAIGFSPGWHATIDGVPAPLGRADDGRLELVLPAGTHEVGLAFREPPAGRIGRAISAVTLAAAGTVALVQRRRRTRSEPVADTGSKSMASARR